MNACWTSLLSLKLPTAHAVSVAVVATPKSWLSMSGPPGSGDVTRFQAVPFQCKMSVWNEVSFEEVVPTAHALPVEVAPTPSRKSKTPGLGLRTWLQRVPFQCTMKVLGSVRAATSVPGRSTRPARALVLETSPTAQTSVADVEVTQDKLLTTAGLGLFTRFQAVPFQCTIRLRVAPLPLPKLPTAQTSLADTTRTASSVLKALPGLGLIIWLHWVPSQCRIMVFVPAPGPVPSSKLPTAQTLSGEAARTANRKLSLPPGSGLGTTDQDEPSQCSVRVCSGPASWLTPTAQVSDADSTFTLSSSLSCVPGLSGGTAGPSPVTRPASISGPASAPRQRPGIRWLSIAVIPLRVPVRRSAV